MKREFIFIGLLFFLISILVISGIVFNDRLIGRSMDFSVPPVDYLAKNNYLISFYQWWGTMNGGSRNTFIPTVIPVNSILYLPVLFGAGVWFIGRYQIILTLFSAMFFFYLLSRRLLEDYKVEEKYKIILSIISSLFFTFNGYFFCELIFGSNAMYFTFALIPLLLYSAISYLKYPKKIYFILSLLSLIIISSMLQHLILAYIFLFLLAIIYKNFKFFIKLGFLHFFLSLYWILPLLYSFSQVAAVEMTAVNFSISLLESSVTFLDALILKEYFSHRNLYNLALNSGFLSSLWVFNSFILLITSFVILFKTSFAANKIHKKMILGFSVIFMLSVLFIKGGREPFGNIILYLYDHFLIFSLYRSLQHYISFYVVSVSILFLFSAIYLINKNKNFIYFLFVLVFINAMPWWYTLDLGSKNITSENSAPSFFSQYYLTKGNEKMYALNKLPLDFSIMHFPPGYSINFLALDKNEFNFITRSNRKIKSQGGDNGLYYGNKRFFATDGPQHNLSNVFDNLEKDMYMGKDFFKNYKNLFSLLGARYFVVREDTVPEFSKYRTSFDLKNIKKEISAIEKEIDKNAYFSSIEKEDFITIAKFKDFLPHFYTPENIIISTDAVDLLSDIVSKNNYKIRSTIYFDSQNENRMNDLKVLDSEVKEADLPIIEFKKINSTKYRVIIHRARNKFPLVFSESFHSDWKAYLTKPNNIQSPDFQTNLTSKIGNYKILEENEGDQANKEELSEYIKNGWISSLGGKKNIDFISKNFQGTIQNDNLSNGKIWDTWSKEFLPEENHFMANGYANSWLIDIDNICKDRNSCFKNLDGTYNLDVMVEFWPQRLFYIGLFISIMILLIFVGCLVYYWRKNKKVVRNL